MWKKVFFIFVETVACCLFSLCLIFVLHYYQATTLLQKWNFPQAQRVITNDIILSSVFGFYSIKEIGKSLIVIIMMFFFTYLMVVFVLYWFRIFRKVLFWINVFFVCCFLSFLILGILFLVLNF